MPVPSSRTPAGRILIVDDNHMGLVARKSVLTEQGHEVVTCQVPANALELCLKQNFHVIVTDYRMPGMNGVDFIRELRKLKVNVPVILLSGFSEALGLTEANTGADAVIQKSASEVAHLVRSVNRLLRVAKKPAASQKASQKLKAKGASSG
jgi:CheY-like chemotaxis protein